MTIDDLRSGFAEPPASAAPMMRWWWFGPSVSRPELERELTAMAAAGIGGVEVAYVYPLVTATTEFGSDAFLADLRFAAERAHELGLRFDLTLGSGWSFGGPHISTELAARQLHWERREIDRRPLEIPVISPWPGDELIAAYIGGGSLQEQPSSYVPLPVVDGRLMIKAGVGPRVVLLGYARLTGQNVKRAAAGAEGPVLDHYSAAAIEAHLDAVGDPMLDTVPADLVGSVFCDSLEVYGADWTASLPAEFARRRGYDMLPMLYLLTVDGSEAARLRCDYHRTLVELYEENFVAGCQRWAAARGVPFRIQGYGTPPATISSYRFADLFEGEGWGWREITQTRWASSAAHLYGRSVTSAEVWTWVHSPSFRATPLDLKGEAHEHLLNGINQFIGHGWPYSPSDAPGLGWFFYAAGALDDRNPWWPAMPELSKYLGRLCWLLQQGEPVADVALYVPNQDLFAIMGRARGGSLDTWREARRRIPKEIPATIRNAGLDYDVIDDDAIMITPPDRYQVVIVPTTTMIMDATASWLDRVVTAGGSVIMIDSTVQMAGAITVAANELAEALGKAVSPDLELSPSPADVGFVHRRCRNADVYVIINTGPAVRDFGVVPRASAGSYEQWDAMSGHVLGAGAVGEGIDLTLHPYEATVLGLTDGPVKTVSRDARGRLRLPLRGPWRLAYGDEPAQPVEVPHVWEDEPDRQHYSGAATYTTSIDLTAVDGPVWIDFGDCEMRDGGSTRHDLVGPSYRVGVRGPVGEVAQVQVNGIDCGLAWAPPYRVEITEAVHAGANKIEVIVYNTAANALAADKHISRLAADSEARYGRRFRMQDLDKALATARSGLLQVPTIQS
ncbi:MAG: glycosyl hydrolase [Propionibacteriaceae bacterium]